MQPSSYRISNGNLSAQVTDFGASLTDLRLAGVNRPLVLGFPDLNEQVADGQFMGAVIGRYANRIAGGHVPWDDGALGLEKNEGGQAHLHGGAQGFATAMWQLRDTAAGSVSFTLESPDGAAGYPGHFMACAKYDLSDNDILRLTLSATSDKDTIVNLCHHPYFNLDGADTVSQHQLWIAAPVYLPSDADLIPTGQIAHVVGSSYDFQTERVLPKDVLYNNTFCLHRGQTGPLTYCASLRAGGVRLDLSTTQPGLHFYNGYKIKPGGQGHGQMQYRAGAGLCLEAQAWPDSPNKPNFPPVRLAAGATYHQVTEYRLSVDFG